MVQPGTMADWTMLALLLGGLASASWLLYAWVLLEPEPEPVGVRQEDLTTAASPAPAAGLPSSPHRVPTRIVTGAVGFQPAR
jgi:hypothetical protein